MEWVIPLITKWFIPLAIICAILFVVYTFVVALGD